MGADGGDPENKGESGMKFVSWNVNGLRACLKKGFVDSVLGLDAQFICLQETKMERGLSLIHI